MSSRTLVGAIIGLVLLGALGIGVAIGYRSYKRSDIAEARQIAVPPGIDTLITVTLDDVRQVIQVRGRDRSNPILLFLHGGPGSPWTAVAWRYQDAWEEHFTVVHWDQRGSGLNYYNGNLKETLSMEQLHEDATELIAFLREWSGQDRIVLMGYSWGSILGVQIALEHPEWLSAYVGVGQYVSWDENEQLTYDWVMHEAVQAKDGEGDVEDLKKIGRPPYQGQILEKVLEQRKIAMKYGAFMHNVSGVWPIISSILLSPDYSLETAQRYDQGSRDAVAAIIPELLGYDLRSLGTTFDVPVFFFEGRHDWSNASTLAAQYFESIDAPHKELVWFENSAHVPMLEEPEAFTEALVKRVAPVARGQRSEVR